MIGLLVYSYVEAYRYLKGKKREERTIDGRRRWRERTRRGRGQEKRREGAGGEVPQYVYYSIHYELKSSIGFFVEGSAPNYESPNIT
jgi:hypothetical protein